MSQHLPPWKVRAPSHEIWTPSHTGHNASRNQATATGNMHKDLVNFSCVVFELCVRTDKQTWSLQYSASQAN